MRCLIIWFKFVAAFWFAIPDIDLDAAAAAEESLQYVKSEHEGTSRQPLVIHHYLTHAGKTNNFVGASTRLAVELVSGQISVMTAIYEVIRKRVAEVDGGCRRRGARGWGAHIFEELIKFAKRIYKFLLLLFR